MVASVEKFGRQSVTGLIRHYMAKGQSLAGIAIIAGSLIDPQRIANAHIRIHALEGRLFRNVVVDVAERNRLACSIWREREIYGRAAEILKKPEPELRAALSALGRPGVRPWRAEQKVAALGAWLVLAGSVREIKGIPRGRTAV